MLLWQDFPLQWGYARGVRKQAVRQAREAVDLLGHHPSIVIWCGHNEPVAVDVDPATRPTAASRSAGYVAGQQLPTWNRTVLDRSVKRALEQADGTRPVDRPLRRAAPPARSSTAPTATSTSAGTTATSATSPASPPPCPRMVRFVSEFGAQAVPDDADFMEPERWPDLDWERLGRAPRPAEARASTATCRPADYATFDEWRHGHPALPGRRWCSTTSRRCAG